MLSRCFLVAVLGPLLLVVCGGKAVVDAPLAFGAGGDGGAGGPASVGVTSTATGVTSSSGGPSAECDNLIQAYAAQLNAARVCAPEIDQPQCTETVDDELQCPCPTFINPANTSAVSALVFFRESWDAEGCGEQIACPAVECPMVQGGGCLQDGRCSDFFPD